MLSEQIAAECSGDYKQFLYQMCAHPADADCEALFAAMDGMGTTTRVIVSASTTRLLHGAA